MFAYYNMENPSHVAVTFLKELLPFLTWNISSNLFEGGGGQWVHMHFCQKQP